MVRTILVADDEKDNIELIRKLLTYEGYEVIEAQDGEEAIEKTFANKPDLILLDVMMPKKNGMEVCEHLKSKSETAGIPILMLTAKREVNDMVKGLDLGADDYITKPFNFRELLARINAHLRVITRKEENAKKVLQKDPVEQALELIAEAQGRSKSIFSNALAEEVMMFELGSINDFNRFSAEVKNLENVSIKDVKVFESKYIVRLSIFPPAFNKIT